MLNDTQAEYLVEGLGLVRRSVDVRLREGNVGSLTNVCAVGVNRCAEVEGVDLGAGIGEDFGETPHSAPSL